LRIQNISGHLPKLSFALVDDQGRAVSASDYRGRIVLLYFGFAGCSAQCPITMDRVAHLLTQLGQDAQGVSVLFVTIDPRHDGPRQLKSFLAAFNPKQMTGLTGDETHIAALAKAYRTAWRPDRGVDISHGDTIYIFDRNGNTRLLLTPDDKDSDAIEALRQMVKT
jgi:protein SCO1/2